MYLSHILMRRREENFCENAIYIVFHSLSLHAITGTGVYLILEFRCKRGETLPARLVHPYYSLRCLVFTAPKEKVMFPALFSL